MQLRDSYRKSLRDLFRICFSFNFSPGIHKFLLMMFEDWIMKISYTHLSGDFSKIFCKDSKKLSRALLKTRSFQKFPQAFHYKIFHGFFDKNFLYLASTFFLGIYFLIFLWISSVFCKSFSFPSEFEKLSEKNFQKFFKSLKETFWNSLWYSLENFLRYFFVKSAVDSFLKALFREFL